MRNARVYGVLWLAAAACSDGMMTGTDNPPAELLPIVRTLSNRADLISGGDALVEVKLPPMVGIEKLKVTLGSADVTSAFAVRADGRVTGLVTGLPDGPSSLNATIGGSHGVTLTITNHKIGGPVLSGPQVTPFVCATPTPEAGTDTKPATNASGLSTRAIDDQCNIATEVALFYRTTAPGCRNVRPDPSPPATAPADACFRPYTASATDVAMTTTTSGAIVPYIVRVERGTLNRGIYELAVLFDPKADDPKTGWKPWAPQRGWNGKVVYSFGASTGQPRRQFRSEQTWADDVALSGGFLVAINSMTDSLYNSNRVSVSETVLMMKEKITESYGEITYTIGNGCSGGSINQLTTASIFPGLLDGIQPTCTYPDAETTGIEVADCSLLVDFYNTPEWKALMAGKTQAAINAKKAAINGHVDQTGCHAWVNSFSNLGRPGNYIPTLVLDNDTGATGPDPRVTTPINNCQLPSAMVYDKASNPTGVRCTAPDHAVGIFGAADGKARDTRDNVGVQYGLAAFKAGAITAEEFVTLNEKIGGADADDVHTAARSVADPDALATAYRAGIVSDGAHLAQIPIIDLRGNDDSNKSPPAPPGALGIHHTWRSFSLRARLDDANGNHDNHVMWRYGTSLVAAPASGLTVQAFVAMDRWLGAIHAAGGTGDAAAVVAAKPKDAVDFCFLPSDTTFSTKVTDLAVCDAEPALQKHASPRQVAGGPLRENILKCQLRAIDRAEYGGADALTQAQFDRLKAAFPDGVCDFTKPGVGQAPAEGPLTFEAGPGGRALPTPPGIAVH
jgi:hypothetical protein